MKINLEYLKFFIKLIVTSYIISPFELITRTVFYIFLCYPFLNIDKHINEYVSVILNHFICITYPR